LPCSCICGFIFLLSHDDQCMILDFIHLFKGKRKEKREEFIWVVSGMGTSHDIHYMRLVYLSIHLNGVLWVILKTCKICKAIMPCDNQCLSVDFTFCMMGSIACNEEIYVWTLLPLYKKTKLIFYDVNENQRYNLI